LYDPPRSSATGYVDFHLKYTLNSTLQIFVDSITKKMEVVETKPELSLDERNERARFRETILHWQSFSLTYGDTNSITLHLPRLLVQLFVMQGDKDEDISKLARHTLALVAQAALPREVIVAIFEDLLTVSKHNNWHTRSAVLPFLQILIFNHIFLLPPDELKIANDIILKHLVDPQIEVRELAKIALSSVVKTTNPDIESLVKRLSALAPISKKKNSPGSITDNLVERHGGVLGLCAVIGSSPYDIPYWMPELLSLLSSYSNDISTKVRESVRQAFAEFWRTHQDMWSILKSKFTEDQLQIINEQVFSPTYYA